MGMFQQQLPQFQDMLDTLPSESARYIPGAWEEIQERAGGQSPINPNNPFEQNPYLSGYAPPPPMQNNANYASGLSAIGNNMPAMLAGQYGIPVQHTGPAGMSPPKNFLGGY
jgi:hypothetical protein